MRDIVNSYANRFRHMRKTRMLTIAALVVLALAVSGCVFWQLHYTGVALANETYCLYEEHQHDESCYEYVKVCGMDECNETAGHTHDDSCYEKVRTLTCGHEETAGHTHGVDCFETKEILTCELSGEEGHIHQEECFAVEKYLICDLTEEEEHIHGNDCYTEEQVQICGMEEAAATEGHVHDETCYEKILICEMPLHTHTIECMIDETADVETAGDWETSLPQLTGVWADDVVAIAQSQIGYTESEKNFRYDEETQTRKGYTRYGAWYGNAYGDWCAMFVSFCLSYAEVPENIFPEEAGVYAWVAELKKMEALDPEKKVRLYAEAGDYSPESGDIIFFDIDKDGKADHTGIVERTETEADEESGEEKAVKIIVIEGNCNNAVCETFYSPDDEIISGYGILPENPENENAESDETDPDEDDPAENGPAEDEEETEPRNMAESVYEAEDGGIIVRVVIPEGALPKDAALEVKLYGEDDDEYAKALAMLEEAAAAEQTEDPDYGEDKCSFIITVGETEEDEEEEDADAVKFEMVLLDISFILDGEKIEPSESADVIIDASVLIEDIDEEIKSLNVWHFEPEEEETDTLLSVPVLDTEEAGRGIVEFTTESFSDFAVQWYPDYNGDKNHYGQIYVNLLDAETGEKIEGRGTILNYDAMAHESIELAAGSSFINETGTDRKKYLFSYATVSPNDGGDNKSSAENPVKYVQLTYMEADTYTWTYTFCDSNGEALYSYEETGRQSSFEPELNLYFTKEPYVITWNDKKGGGRSYVLFETRNAGTDELLGGSSSWSKPDVTTAIAMTDNGLRGKVSLGADYSYYYATVFDPASGDVYGTPDEPVTEIWAEVTGNLTEGSTWTYSIRSGTDVLKTVTKTYSSDMDAGDLGRDLLITLYYCTYDGELCVALDSRNGDMGFGGRDYIRGLENYAGANGEITINLPDNDHLGKNFVAYKDLETGNKIFVNASRVTRGGAHEWRVVGWYNIATGDYYDVSEGPAEATINIKNDINVFYADLVNGTYDNAVAGDGGFVSEVSTADFVTLQLFDYNELFNLYSSFLIQEGIESEKWDAGYANPYGATLYRVPVLKDIVNLYNSGENITRSFLFQDTNCGDGNLGHPLNLNYWNLWTKDVSDYDINGNLATCSVLPAGTWGIDSPSSELLNMLFDTTESSYGVHYIGNPDGLFQFGGKDAENLVGANGETYNFYGYYYYSANLNAAVYNQSENRFYLYDSTQKANWKDEYNMFLPFNPYNPSGISATTIDYWFGMKMEVDFYLPAAAGTTSDGSYVNVVDGNNMRFNFSGDDDIMVFVDNQLVLDMAGIHDEADGYIDFADGTYSYVCRNQASGSVNAEPYEGKIKLDSGTHKLSVFYLERGAGASNLTVSFNVVPEWQYYSDEITTVKTEKEWEDGIDSHTEDSVKMGLFEEVFTEEYSTADGGRTYEITIGENTLNCTFEDDPAYAFDDEGMIVAFFEDGTLFVRMEETPAQSSGIQTLNAENEWTFAWELLGNERTYRVLELAGPENYAAVSSSSVFDSWRYWSIIGETEIEEMFGDASTHYVILTDAAAQSDPSEKYPQGYVVRNDRTLTSLVFSKAPQWRRGLYNEVYAVFGEFADSEVQALTNGEPAIFVRFEIAFTGNLSIDGEFVNSSKVHTFYLKPQYQNGRYLKLNSSLDGLEYTSLGSEAAAFYIDSRGELCIDGEHKRVVIEYDDRGNAALKVADRTDDVDYGSENINIRVYTLSDVPTSGTSFKFVNTPVFPMLPDTGGPGIWLYILTGLILVMGAVYRFYTGGGGVKE